MTLLEEKVKEAFQTEHNKQPIKVREKLTICSTRRDTFWKNKTLKRE